MNKHDAYICEQVNRISNKLTDCLREGGDIELTDISIVALLDAACRLIKAKDVANNLPMRANSEASAALIMILSEIHNAEYVEEQESKNVQSKN